MTQVAIQIPDDLKPFIDQSVKSGLFCDAADFVVDLLYNVKAESENASPEEVSAKLHRLRTEINIGLDQLRNGEGAEFDAEDIIQRGRARLAARQQAS